MTDIVDRLRERQVRCSTPHSNGMPALADLYLPDLDCQAAADEIARLRRWKSTNAPRLEALQGLLETAQRESALGLEARTSLASEREANALMTEEIERLRAELADLKQTSGELCSACGWRFVVPGRGCIGCKSALPEGVE